VMQRCTDPQHDEQPPIMSASNEQSQIHFVRPKAAAARFGVTEREIWYWVEAGYLKPPVRLSPDGRAVGFPSHELDAYAASLVELSRPGGVPVNRGPVLNRTTQTVATKNTTATTKPAKKKPAAKKSATSPKPISASRRTRKRQRIATAETAEQ
jgi:predicted DNA-binding transcriptional regulator AlpA